MIRRLTCLAVLFAVTAPATAQPPPEIAPVKLTLSPAAAPSPALKYELLPDLKDQTPGNAALEYYRAFSPEWWGNIRQPKVQETFTNALQTPPRDLPRKDLDWLLTNRMLQQVDHASRREYCDWEMAERLRKEGINLLLPDVQGLRQVALLLAVRARLEIAEGHYDKALYTLQTGFALARNAGNSVTLIQTLVGVAIGQQMVLQLEELVQQPGAPNLYWALTELPHPFFDLRAALQGEKLWLYASLPELRDLETARLTPEQQQNLVNAYTVLDGRKPTESERLEATLFVLRAYPEAKRALIAEGRKPEEVEALPSLQVVLIHSLHQYQRLQDDMFKWYGLPYWEARPHFEQADRRIRQARARLEGVPFIEMIPAILKAAAAPVRLERRVAALRCVEAIRLYAAGHDGKLPGSLDKITEVPIPIDPMTGKAFAYRVSDDRATLSAPAPPGEQANPYNTLTYELTLRR